MRTVFLRRGLVALFAAAVSFGAITQAQAESLRIGYQKYGTLVLLKAKGTLEKRLADQGIQVQWTEFPGGPQLLEGLNVGSIDFGVTGETPPVFAQAAGADLLYVAYEPPAPHTASNCCKTKSRSFTKASTSRAICWNCATWYKWPNSSFARPKAAKKAGVYTSAAITPTCCPRPRRLY